MNIDYYKKYEPIDGKWYITRELGSGAFGRVFEVERRDFTNAKSAMKVITIPASPSEVQSYRDENYDLEEQSVTSYFYGFVEEFTKEFEVMLRLKGQNNIVSIEDYDVKEHENEIGWDIFIRMELLTPMNQYFSQHPPGERDVVRLGIDICKALEVCQIYKIVHRDIKPSNIFVSDTGVYKLGDFGVARTLEKTSSGLSKKGTYTYMAPEVFRGEEYGSNVDLYSLGIVMYKILNNNLEPFRKDRTHSDEENALALRMKGEALPKPANADGRLAEIVLKACSYKPKNRYESPLKMREELEAILRSEKDGVIPGEEEERTVGIFGEGGASAGEKDATVGMFGRANASFETADGGERVAEEERTVGIFGKGGASIEEEDATVGMFGKRNTENAVNSSDDARDGEIDNLLRSADQLHENGRYIEEIETLKYARKRKPADVDVLLKLGCAYESESLHDEALKVYQEALQIVPYNFLIPLNMGVVYFRMGDCAGAMRESEAALRLATEGERRKYPGDYAILLCNYGIFTGKNGDREKAAFLLKKAEQCGYGNIDAALAMLEMSRSEYQNAPNCDAWLDAIMRGSSPAKNASAEPETGKTGGTRPANPKRKIGIDLGTTNLRACVMENGKYIMIPDALGRTETPPSVAYTKSGEWLVGWEAKQQAAVNPDGTRLSVIRDIETYQKVILSDKQYTKSHLLSFLLAKLKKDAEQYFGCSISEAAIGVPSHFGILQRKWVKLAAQEAGFALCRIYNAVSAAAAVCGVPCAENVQDETQYLVCNAGGGSFETALYWPGDELVEISRIESDGDAGGAAFDRRIVDYAAAEFQKKSGIDLREDKAALRRLAEAAEQAKTDLSTAPETNIFLPNIAMLGNLPQHLDVTLTRAKFDELTADLIRKIQNTIRKTLSGAELSASQISNVYLLGGGSRIPAVREAVLNEIRRKPGKQTNPCECAARGLAKLAKMRKSEEGSFIVIDLLTQDIGLKTQGGHIEKVIKRERTIPCRTEKQYTTAADNQSDIGVHVVEFTGDETYILLGDFLVNGIIPPAPKGVPLIEVQFDMDENYTLQITARNSNTNKESVVATIG